MFEFENQRMALSLKERLIRVLQVARGKRWMLRGLGIARCMPNARLTPGASRIS